MLRSQATGARFQTDKQTSPKKTSPNNKVETNVPDTARDVSHVEAGVGKWCKPPRRRRRSDDARCGVAFITYLPSSDRTRMTLAVRNQNYSEDFVHPLVDVPYPHVSQ